MNGGKISPARILAEVLHKLHRDVIGIALGLLGSGAIARLAEWPMLVQPASLVIAFVFAGAVGIFFGYYPARKAARLDPIDALRYE